MWCLDNTASCVASRPLLVSFALAKTPSIAPISQSNRTLRWWLRRFQCDFMHSPIWYRRGFILHTSSDLEVLSSRHDKGDNVRDVRELSCGKRPANLTRWHSKVRRRANLVQKGLYGYYFTIAGAASVKLNEPILSNAVNGSKFDTSRKFGRYR